MFQGNQPGLRVAFYIRVSTEEQSRDGFGAEMQLQWLTEMIEYRGKVSGWTHSKQHIYRDLWCTGANLVRGEYQRMMQDAKDGKFDMIAVWKIDRLSRNLSHLLSTFELLQSYKVGFFSHKENIDFTGPIGKLTFQIFGALAEFERETIKTRTKEGKITSARFGNYVMHNTPYGYQKESLEKKRNRSLTIIEEEKVWVNRIFEEYIWGKSLGQIAKMMNEAKVPKNDGNLKKQKYTKWHGSTIKDILQNTAYIGCAYYNAKDDQWKVESIEIEVPSIVHPMTFEIVQKKLESLSEDVKRWGGETEYLLSRKIVHIDTGRKFVGVKRSKDGRVSYRRKAFESEGVSYKNMEIPGDPIEKLVWDTIYQMIHRPKDLFEVFQRQSIESKDYDILYKERLSNQKEIEKLGEQEHEIELDYYKGKHSDEKRDALVAIVQQQIQSKIVRNRELDTKLDSIVRAEETKQAFERFTTDFETNLENLTFNQKKLLIDLLVETIEVTTVASQLNVNIKLRFVQSKVGQSGTGDEPKNPTTKPWNGGDGTEIDRYGATSWTWTSGLLLRREAL